MYSFSSRVRYSEIDENRKMTLYSLMNYFQDTCTFHSDSLHRGGEVLENIHRSWVLSSWQICINRFPQLGEEIQVNTWPYEFHGFLGGRNFQMTTKEGEVLAYANSLWTYLNTENGLPVRIGPVELEAYVLEEKLDMDYAPRKIKIPKEFEVQESFSIKKHHLDTNHHVNNTQYVRFAQEYLPQETTIRQMRAEYKKQAYWEDVVVPHVTCNEGIYTVTLCNEENIPYAVVEFQ